MFNRSKYKTLLKIVLVLAIIAVVGVILVSGYKMYNLYYISIGATKAAVQFEEAAKRGNNTTTKYKEFTVIGTIQIPSIDLKYPILEKNTTEALETSLVLMYTSQGLNNSGNSVIMGHNYRNNILFSNLKNLKERDTIYITDNTGRKIKYEIYSVYTNTDGDNNYITRNTEGKKEISLSTSTDDSKAKTVVLAREK